MDNLEEINGLEELKAKLLLLPDNCKGILFIEQHNVKRASELGGGWSQNLKSRGVQIELVCCRDIEGLKFLKL